MLSNVKMITFWIWEWNEKTKIREYMVMKPGSIFLLYYFFPNLKINCLKNIWELPLQKIP